MITAPCKGVGGPGRTGYSVTKQSLSGFVGQILSHAPIDLFGSNVPPFHALAHTHFVGFRDDRYHAAVRVFGVPDFIHIGWDRRALREIGEGDVVVFADGPHDQEPRAKSFPDIIDGSEIGWRWPQMGGAA